MKQACERITWGQWQQSRIDFQLKAAVGILPPFNFGSASCFGWIRWLPEFYCTQTWKNTRASWHTSILIVWVKMIVIVTTVACALLKIWVTDFFFGDCSVLASCAFEWPGCPLTCIAQAHIIVGQVSCASEAMLFLAASPSVKIHVHGGLMPNFGRRSWAKT